MCADNVNLLRANINNIQKNTKALLDASKENGLEEGPNAEKTKYMFTPRHQNTRRGHNNKDPFRMRQRSNTWEQH
jgi:hypothetical protein